MCWRSICSGSRGCRGQRGLRLPLLNLDERVRERSSGMLRTIREDWGQFKASKPGHRFRDRYRHHWRSSHQRSSQSRFYFRKVLFIVGGVAIALGSIVLAPLPGPGLGTLLLGLVILATELRIIAGFFDRAEVKFRRPLRRAKGTWASLPRRARIFFGAVASIGSVAFGLWVLLYSFSWLAL